MGELTSAGIVSPVLLFCLAFGGGLAFSGVLFGLNRFQAIILAVLASTWIRAFFIVNERIPPSEVESNTGTYLRLALLGVAGLAGAFYFLQARHKDNAKLPSHFALLALFLLYALISASYSLDRSFTLARTAEFAAFAAFLLGVHTWLTNQQRFQSLMNVILWVIVLGLVINVSARVLVPHMVWFYQIPSRYQGVMGDPNNLGGFLLMSYPVLMWKYTQSGRAGRNVMGGLIVLAMALHVLSGSRSSIGAAVVGVLAWHCMLNQKVKAAALATAGVAVAVVIYTSPFASFQRESESNVFDLTGRTGIWDISVNVFQQKPITGFGFQVGGAILSKVNLDISDWYLSESVSARFTLHNGYLSIGIGNGVIGLLLWCVILAIPLVSALKLPRSPLKAMLVALFAQALFLNFLEDFIVCGPRFTAPLIFWLGWVAAGRAGYITGTDRPFQVGAAWNDDTVKGASHHAQSAS